jgi:hypothetical protein
MQDSLSVVFFLPNQTLDDFLLLWTGYIRMDKKRPLPSMIHQDNFLVSCLVRRQLAGDRPLAGHVNMKVPYGAWWPRSTPSRFFLLRRRGGRRPVRLPYQPPASSIFLSEQTSNQPTTLFSQNKPAPAISHQSTEQSERR